jgi:glycerol-3-phosphate acyltransferase PlsY
VSGLSVLGATVAGYVLGTFPSADLVTRAATRGTVDIRRSGSGNPGGFNAIRVVGPAWGVAVIVLDACKGAVAGLVGGAIAGDAGVYAAAAAVIAGHCWPVWARFRGGKGVAAAGGSYAVAFPPFFVLGGGLALATTLAFRRTRLTVAAVTVAWVAAAVVWAAADLPMWWGPAPDLGLVLYSALGSAVLLAKFRAPS